jgi:hypothetical protein
MLLSAFAFALLELGYAIAQFPFTGKHETARCRAENRATDETMAIEIRERQPGTELNALSYQYHHKSQIM